MAAAAGTGWQGESAAGLAPLPQAVAPVATAPQMAAPQMAANKMPVQRMAAPSGVRFCGACGNSLVATAAICPKCGSSVGTPKDKTIAVLLAVFLGGWTWCYTYQADKKKFWWSLALSVLGTILTLVLVGFLIVFGVWLWAVIDAAKRPDEFYRKYPVG